MTAQIALAIFGAALTLLTGLILAKVSKQEKDTERRENERDERDELILKSIDANGCVIKELYECRFHDKPANGELEEAYQYHRDVKHELEAYMRRRASRD
jgi:hypothetical protein